MQVEKRPNVINRESAARRLVVQCNVAGRGVAGVTRELERRLRAQLSLPQGYYLEVEGEYEAQLSARRELTFLGAAALLGIFLLLYADFHSVRSSLLILVNLPLAFIGAVWAVVLSGASLSLGSMVGFLALLGITARNGIMLVSHYRHLQQEAGMPFGHALIMQGSVDRLTPILMTALAAIAGMLPLAFALGAGSQMLQPLAIAVIGGLVVSMLLSLIVTPVIFAWLREAELRKTTHQPYEKN